MEKREEMIHEQEKEKRKILLDKIVIDNNRLKEIYEKERLTRKEKEFFEKHNMLSEKYERLQQLKNSNFVNLQKQIYDYKNKYEEYI
jgi:hypothetical protein